MKGLTKSLTAKVIAMFILVISFVLGCGSVIAFSYLGDQGYYDNVSYSSEKLFLESNAFARQAWRDSQSIADYVYNGYTQEEIDRYLGERNFSYTVYLKEVDFWNCDDPEKWLLENGKNVGIEYDDDIKEGISEIKRENTIEDKPIYDSEEEYELYETKVKRIKLNRLLFEDEAVSDDKIVKRDSNDFYYDYGDGEIEIQEIYEVTLNFQSPVEIEDTYYDMYHMFNLLYSARYWIIVLGIIMAIVFIASFIFLMCAAGHRAGTDEIVPNFQDKIHLDVYAALMAVAITFSVLFVIVSIESFYGFRAFAILLTGLSLVIFVSLVLACVMTLATRIKMGRFWKNTLIYMIIKAIGKGLGGFFDNLQFVFKWMFAFCVLALINILGIFILPVTLIIDVVAFIWLYREIVALNVLKEAGEKIAAGNLEEKVDVDSLKGDLRRHGEALNSISVGMGRAVEQKMKSERFKTELITNVSHDIKTPLTSIINYIDLIRKEEPEGKIDEYSQVLEKQANRLKKLLEDLIEASKASTGNIPVEFNKTDVCEIINQAVGEYSEKLEHSGVEVVVNLPEEPTFVMADGRKLWRIFDNVLSNICKYAQKDTRAYIDVLNKGERVNITFKNISRERLNIASDELMERFVRGDSSRNTEGSGLGLNIAKSFAELQRGTFEIVVDGDLFKVEISFERCE